MKVKAKLKNYRKSPKKVRDLCPLIKGLPVGEAIASLKNCPRGVSYDLIGLIESAMANAKNNFNLESKGLIIESLVVDEGRVMKRWRARAYGRAAQILKRSCHINLTLEEVKKSSPEVLKKVTSKELKEKEKSKEEKADDKNIK